MIFSPLGFFCPNSGMSAALPCPAGAFCGATSLTFVSGNCSTGYYCPSGSFAPTMCPPGSFCPTTNMANFTLCPAGSFCGVGALSAVSGPCAAGFFCTTGSSSATRAACTARNYCPAGSSAMTPCIDGAICPTAAMGNYTLWYASILKY
jgi:hypothetical protein